MLDEKMEISDEKVIELYLAGYSQKDIATKCNTTPIYLRSILKAKGFETHRFRALDDETTNVIIQLITKGVYFYDVENICDISFHAIREVVARNNLQRASKNARYNNVVLDVPEDYERNVQFLERYMAGECFCALCKDFSLSNEEIVYEFLSIDEEHVLQHKKMLRKKVLADVKLEFSPTAIARKYNISTSIVRNILKQKPQTPEEFEDSSEANSPEESADTQEVTDTKEPADIQEVNEC